MLYFDIHIDTIMRLYEIIITLTSICVLIYSTIDNFILQELYDNKIELIWISLLTSISFNYYHIRKIVTKNFSYVILLISSIAYFFMEHHIFPIVGIMFFAIAHMNKYKTIFLIGEYGLIIALLHQYIQFNAFTILVITCMQSIILLLLNVIMKHMLINKYSAVEIYCRNILGSNVITWSLFTLNILAILASWEFKNLLGFMIVSFQYIQNRGQIDKQFRSVPNLIITILVDTITKYCEEYTFRYKELEINDRTYERINKADICHKYELQIGDIIKLEKHDHVPMTTVPIECDEENIYVSTIQLDGEKQLKLKKVMSMDNALKLIDKFNEHTHDSEYSHHINIIRKDSQTESSFIGLIIHNNPQLIHRPKLYNLDKIIKQTEYYFAFLTLICILIDGLLDKFTMYNLLAYFMNVQMINPMSIMTITLLVLNLVKYKNLLGIKYISLFGKKQIIDFINKFEINHSVDTINAVHCTDKTGTLTANCMNYHMSHFSKNADKTLLKEYIIRSTSNTKQHKTLIPEETEYFNKLNIEWNNYVDDIKNNQLFFGFSTIHRAVVSLNHKEDNYWYMLVQSGEDFATKHSNAPNLHDIYDYASSINLDISNGAPRFWYLMTSDDMYFDDDVIHDLSNELVEINNNNSQSDRNKLIDELLNGRKLHYYSCQIMTDEYRDDVRDLIKFNKNNNIMTVIITGDNKYATERIAHDLGISGIYMNKKSQIDFIDGLYDIVSDSLICYESETNLKGMIVNKLREKYNCPVVYSGDGKNDIVALDNADLSIGFMDNTNTIDPELSLVSGIIAKNNFWTSYVSNGFWNYMKNLKNTLHRSYTLLIIKQAIVAGIIFGAMYWSNFELITDPFSGSYYLIFQLIAFLFVCIPIYYNNKTTYYLSPFNLLMFGIEFYYIGFILYTALFNGICYCFSIDGTINMENYISTLCLHCSYIFLTIFAFN